MYYLKMMCAKVRISKKKKNPKLCFFICERQGLYLDSIGCLFFQLIIFLKAGEIKKCIIVMTFAVGNKSDDHFSDSAKEAF